MLGLGPRCTGFNSLHPDMNWIILGLLSAFFAALVAIFGKIGISHIDTTLATSIRAIVMAAFFIIVSLFLKKFDLINTLDKKALIFIFLSGLAGALSWFFYFWALKNGPVTAVAILDRLSVVFVLILAALFLGEGITWKSLTGIALVVIGAVLLVK